MKRGAIAGLAFPLTATHSTGGFTFRKPLTFRLQEFRNDDEFAQVWGEFMSMTLQRRVAAWAAFVSVIALSQPVSAQKNSGPLLPIEPGPTATAPAYRPRPAPYAAPRPAPMSGPMSGPTGAGPGHNPQVERLADRLPIDPQTRDLRDQLPRDTIATERSLGLHPARGPVTDLRGHTPSPGEIANALAPR